MPEVWAIDGVEVSARIARAIPYVGTGGAEGIVERGGLKVAALEVPSTSVRVLPGGAVVRNRYQGGGLQSYAVLEQTQQTVPIVASSSSGPRSDLVIVRVTDTEYASGAAGATFDVIQGVPANAGAEFARTLGYPALALARIDIPASTATITASMITDLRTLAQPRSSRTIINAPMPDGNAVTSSTFGNWPDSGVQVDVPEWATAAAIRIEVLSGLLNPTGSAAEARGDFRIVVDNSAVLVVQAYNYDVAGSNERVPVLIAGRADVAELAGAERNLKLQARRTTGAARLETREDSYYLFDIQWIEEPA